MKVVSDFNIWITIQIKKPVSSQLSAGLSPAKAAAVPLIPQPNANIKTPAPASPLGNMAALTASLFRKEASSLR